MTSTAIVPIQPIALSPSWVKIADWKWHSHQDGDLKPEIMVTRHLFYTLRMIWNHTMPRHMNVGKNIQRYRFSARYTPDYMRQAIMQIGAELSTRTDIADWMKDELYEMARWFTRDEEDRVLTQQKVLK